MSVRSRLYKKSDARRPRAHHTEGPTKGPRAYPESALLVRTGVGSTREGGSEREGACVGRGLL